VPTLAAGDITALTAGVTAIFQNIVDFFVTAAPILVLLAGGWFAIRLVKNLLKGRM